MDAIDMHILSLLQRDGAQPLARIAAEVRLSPNPCWHRIRRMEEAGIILRRVALLDAARLGAGTTAFVTIRMAEKGETADRRLCETLHAFPEVVEIHRVSGGGFLLKLRIASVTGYTAIHQALVRAASISDIAASFAIDTLKSTTEIPLPQI